MKDEEKYLSDEDYREAECPLCMTEGHPIPVGRVIEKLDAYFAVGDEAGAERHLRYWLAEAEGAHDVRGEVAVLSELVGITRKRAECDESLSFAARAVAALDEAGLSDSVTGATVFLNVATAFKAFGRAEEALEYYEKATKLYKKYLKPGDIRFAGLYNNTALALSDLGRDGEAEDLFLAALAILEPVEGTEPERAVTYTNLASLAEKTAGCEAGEEKIAAYLTEARRLLRAAPVRDAGLAYVLEKCAPVFDYYGYFADAAEFSQEAKRIYEGA